jgi:hypothetical protein
MSKPYKEGDILLSESTTYSPVMVIETGIALEGYSSTETFYRVLNLWDAQTLVLSVGFINAVYKRQE